MKILYLNYLYDIYGASLGSAIKPMMLFSEIENLGNDVRFCWMKAQPQSNHTTRHTRNQALKNKVATYLHEPKQFLSNVTNAPKEFKLMRSFRPDVVIARLEVSLFSALTIAKVLQIPFVLEADCPVYYESLTFRPQYKRSDVLLRYLEYINVAHAEAVITQSRILAEYFLAYGIPVNKVFSVPNAADVTRFDGISSNVNIRENYGLKDRLVLGFVGAFSYWHGVENLIRIISTVLPKYDHIAFLLVGAGGKCEPQLRQYIHENGLEHRVVMTGYVPFEKIPDHITAMDVVLAPYPKLDFFYYSPVKLFEYMASAKPIVAPALGQIAEVITDGKDGMLSRPGDIEDMIAKIDRLITDETLRHSIGAAARTTVIRNHTWRHRAQDWLRICDRVIEEYGHDT